MTLHDQILRRREGEFRAANGVASSRRPVSVSSRQAYELIRSMIRSGAVVTGERLDERRLVASLGISRTGVRQALADLSDEGLIDRRRRQGTVVSDVPVRVELDAVLGACGAMGEPGAPSHRRVASFEEQQGGAFSGRLAVPSGRVAVVVDVLETSTGPVAVRTVEVDSQRGEALRRAPVDGPLAATFVAIVGRPLGRVDSASEARSCDAKIAVHLGFDASAQAVVLWQEQLAHDAQGNPCLLVRTHYRGDRVALTNVARATRTEEV